MNMKNLTKIVSIIALFLTTSILAVDWFTYQGYIEVDGAQYGDVNGETGFFKFAVCDPSLNTNFWSNDGSHFGEPSNHIELAVYKGLFVAPLGDTSISNMNPINKSMFTSNTDYYVRVFFSDNPTQNWAELTPAAALENPPFYVQNIEENISNSLVTNNNFISAITNQLGDIYNNTNQTGETLFDGTRTVSRAHLPNGQSMGTSNVVEFLNAVFFPFLNATISLSVSPTLVEEGTLQDVTCSGSVTANDETVFSNAYVDPSVGANITFTAQAGAYSVQQTGVSVDTSYRSYITTGNSGRIGSPTRSINFVYPYFWGMTAADLTAGGNPLYLALTKAIQNRGNKAVTYDGNLQYIYFAYPAAYGDLTSIKDPSNLEAFTSFTKYVVNVTSSGLDTDWTVSYNVYRNNDLTIVNNGTFTFTY